MTEDPPHLLSEGNVGNQLEVHAEKRARSKIRGQKSTTTVATGLFCVQRRRCQSAACLSKSSESVALVSAGVIGMSFFSANSDAPERQLAHECRLIIREYRPRSLGSQFPTACPGKAKELSRHGAGAAPAGPPTAPLGQNAQSARAFPIMEVQLIVAFASSRIVRFNLSKS